MVTKSRNALAFIRSQPFERGNGAPVLPYRVINRRREAGLHEGALLEDPGSGTILAVVFGRRDDAAELIGDSRFKPWVGKFGLLPVSWTGR